MMKLLVIASALVLGISYVVSLSQGEDEIGTRIIGGYPAGDALYPHHASLKDKKKIHFCGASIISPSYALTAAHCTTGRKAGDIELLVGTNYLNSGGTTYKVKTITNHPKYSTQTKANDIALLKTSSTIKFNAKVQSIFLASSSVVPNTFCTLAGWGTISYPSNNMSNVLHHISLKTISIPQCQSLLPAYPVNYTNECTYNAYGQGACNGDNGGALICNGVQYAILSWGIPCARGVPDVYTGIAAYRTWIKSVSGV